jgi:hypothetical protein
MVASSSSHTDPVRQARPVLSGSTIVLVGGDERPAHALRLARAFELARAGWIPLREPDPSSKRFASRLLSDPVVLVVALLGLVRHQHAHDLRALCRSEGLPLLSCWRTPSPSGMAEAIVSQRLINSIRARRGL